MMELSYALILFSTVFFMVINPWIRTIFLFIGILTWNSFFFSQFLAMFQQTITTSFLLTIMNFFVFPLFFLVIGIQMLIMGMIKKNWKNLLLAITLLIFLIYTYKHPEVSIRFNLVDSVMRLSILVALFFKGKLFLKNTSKSEIS